MKGLFQKISAILMAFILMLSTMSFTVSMHYCMDELVDTSFFSKAEGCGMEMDADAIEMNGCCDNHEIKLEGQDELKLPVSDLGFEQQLFVVSFLYSYNELFQVVEEDVTHYFKNPPPLLVRKIYKLDESYLI